jgi:TRAP-type uncharacterized transport system substrate-binding protein
MRTYSAWKKWLSILVAVPALSILMAPAAFAQKHKVEISGLWAGTNPYSIAVAWAKLINEKSQIVEAVAREGRGPSVDMKSIVMDPKKAKNLVFFFVEDEMWGAKEGFEGWSEFKGKYDFTDFRHLALSGFTSDVLLTTKPEIQSMKHLHGKSVVISNVSATSAKAVGFDRTFQLGGVKPKYEYLGMKAMVESMRDGLVDVVHGGINALGPGKFAPSPYLNELFAMKKVYPVSLDKVALEAMKKETGHPGIVVTFPPKAISEYQANPVVALGKCMTWGSHKDLPDEVATELVRIYLENINSFAQVTPGAELLTKETIAAIGVPESRYHPAVVQFYKSKGVKITSLQQLKILD